MGLLSILKKVKAKEKVRAVPATFAKYMESF